MPTVIGTKTVALVVGGSKVEVTVYDEVKVAVWVSVVSNKSVLAWIKDWGGMLTNDDR